MIDFSQRELYHHDTYYRLFYLFNLVTLIRRVNISYILVKNAIPANLGSLYAELLQSSIWVLGLRPAFNVMDFYLSGSFLKPGINEGLIFTSLSYWNIGKNGRPSCLNGSVRELSRKEGRTVMQKYLNLDCQFLFPSAFFSIGGDFSFLSGPLENVFSLNILFCYLSTQITFYFHCNFSSYFCLCYSFVEDN